MGFLAPKAPKPPTPANNPILAKDTPNALSDTPYGTGSLISTSPSGLKRKASTQRTSLIGG
jgi:hypothetical protein